MNLSDKSGELWEAIQTLSSKDNHAMAMEEKLQWAIELLYE